MSEEKTCACSTSPKLVFSCSGAADVGALADLTARRLSSESCGRMACLAAIGAGLGSFAEAAKSASVILAIDGCRTDCALKILERAGVEGVSHARITDLGFVKGSSPMTAENVSILFEY
ncbi:zinc-binding protein [Candidatus Fermentibacteria bacterium]|nr:zinc-binding protein [Candidatus Fermentibacteria bacterium]